MLRPSTFLTHTNIIVTDTSKQNNIATAGRSVRNRSFGKPFGCV